MPALTRKDIFLYAFLICVLIGNAFFLNFNAFRIFVFYDMAPYLDACWRILHGQRLYIDFIFPEGPMHLDMMVPFFRLWGFGKAGILAHLIVIHSLVILAVFFILYRKVPVFTAAAAALLTVPSFYWAFSHPWHDQSAYFWVVLALLIFLRSYPCRDARKVLINSWTCGLLMVFSVMSKTNIGGMFAVIFFLAVLSEGYKAEGILGYIGGITAGLLFFLWLIGSPAEFWQQNALFAAAKAEGRISGRLLDWRVWSANFYWVPVLVVLSNTWTVAVKLRTILILFYGVSLAAIGSIMTGGMRMPAHMTLWGIQMALAFLVFAELEKCPQTGLRKKILRCSSFLLLAWTIVLTAMAVQRGIALKAWYREPGVPDARYYRLKSAPLDGWLMQPREGQTLDLVVEYIKTNVPAGDSLLNLTDLYIIYALTGRDSYRGINYAFFEDVFPASGEQAAGIKKYILEHPPDWIIIRKNSFQYELQKLEMGSEIVSLYYPVYQLGEVLILKRNNAVRN